VVTTGGSLTWLDNSTMINVAVDLAGSQPPPPAIKCPSLTRTSVQRSSGGRKRFGNGPISVPARAHP
jgi:hypothetical protein